MRLRLTQPVFSVDAQRGRGVPVAGCVQPMEQIGEHLVVRQHERISCRLRAAVGVSEDSPSRLVLSRSAGNGTGIVPATVVDCSSGGIGLESSVYLPRQSRLSVRVTIDEDGGGQAGEIELVGTVQRVSMISREPRYYLGLAFKGRHVPSPALIERLLKRASDESAGRAGGATA